MTQHLDCLVFLTEREFLAAPATTRRNRHGYRVKLNDQVYFAWAVTPLQAEGLVSKTAKLMSVSHYTSREVRHHETAEIDPKLLALVTDLSPTQQAKLRVILKR